MRDVVGADMPLDMMHRHQRQSGRKRQRLGAADADQQRADQPRPIGHGNGVYLRQGQIRLLQRARHHRVHRLHMLARGNLRHDPAVKRVRFHLRGHHIGQDASSVFDHRRRGLVA